MDTHYRSPEEINKIIYGEWVVYKNDARGEEVLATVQDFSAITRDGVGRYPDTSYTIKEGGVSYKEHFKCRVQYTSPRTGVGHVLDTRCKNIRPMTEEENKDLEAYFREDYALIINSKLLKEAVKRKLKTGSALKPVNETFL